MLNSGFLNMVMNQLHFYCRLLLYDKSRLVASALSSSVTVWISSIFILSLVRMKDSHVLNLRLICYQPLLVLKKSLANFLISSIFTLMALLI